MTSQRLDLILVLPHFDGVSSVSEESANEVEYFLLLLRPPGLLVNSIGKFRMTENSL